MDGYLYVNLPQGPDDGSGGGCDCIKLATGQLVWWQNITVSCGQILDYESPNQHGAIGYLWNLGNPMAAFFGLPTAYTMYDPLTGDRLLTLDNAMAGRVTMDAQGDMLVYVLNNFGHWLAMWNSSYAPYMQGVMGTELWSPPVGAALPWLAGVQWNVTIPKAPGFESVDAVGDNVLLASCQAGPDTLCAIGYDATTGAQLYQVNFTSNAASLGSFFLVPISDGLFIFFRQETMQFYAYNVTTGALVWGPTTPYTNAWGMYTSSTEGLGASNPLIAYGNLYSVAYDGMVHAYNDTNGKNLWNWFDGINLNSPFGQNPLGSGTFAVAGGAVYAATGEHSPVFFNGAEMYCVNATSGQEIWDILGWYQNPAVADGYLTAFNNYDGLLYCFGKGPSATTVSAPQLSTAIGNPVLLQGTVTDQSPGQTCLGIPAAGTPAVSDASMSQWMEYLYMQQPKPTNTTGVQVSLDAIDPNGNFVHLGNTITDASGSYSLTVNSNSLLAGAGTYKVFATFAGTNSYYSSTAETYFTVYQTLAPTPTPASVVSMYFVPSVVAIIVVIIIVGLILALLMLRKRP
jgi:outer membrane protein assembly factor BamB